MVVTMIVGTWRGMYVVENGVKEGERIGKHER